MRKKGKVVYVCSVCGYRSAKWYGRCPACGGFNTFREVEEPGRAPSTSAIPEVVPLAEAGEVSVGRIPSGFRELDRVLGGGFVKGGVYLIGGEPGIGKSTLLLQVAREVSERGLTTLVIAGEESPGQIALRAKRIGAFAERILILPSTDLDVVKRKVEEVSPDFLMVDSIQTLRHPNWESAPGSPVQVRECGAELTRIAKQKGVTTLLVGHVTKAGDIAGPKVLEHLVDVVLYFEGEPSGILRILRGIKNRFGPANEAAFFEMTSAGLREVSDPSGVLLHRRNEPVEGICYGVLLEGSVPVIIEVQALVVANPWGIPRRMCVGYDARRLPVLAAILERRAGIKLGKYDVFVNVPGGIRAFDPGVDLAVALAICSSREGVSINEWVAVGEVGLTGEIRVVPGMEARVREAKRHGFERIISPGRGIKTLKDAIREVLRIGGKGFEKREASEEGN